MRNVGISAHNDIAKYGFVHSRINEDIKGQASIILNKIGLNVSDAIRIFLNQVVMTKGIPFSVCIPNSETIMAMEAAERGEKLEKVTLEQLRTQFKNERKKLIKEKKKNSRMK
jgi:DNA-damage-inducible protein J